MGNSNSLFESLFKTQLASSGQVDFISDIANEHPYFSVAQFFYLQQLQPGDPAYRHQAAKTAILFNNPYWLNFQLEENSSALDLNKALQEADFNKPAEPGENKPSEIIETAETETADAIAIEDTKEPEDATAPVEAYIEADAFPNSQLITPVKSNEDDTVAEEAIEKEQLIEYNDSPVALIEEPGDLHVIDGEFSTENVTTASTDSYIDHQNEIKEPAEAELNGDVEISLEDNIANASENNAEEVSEVPVMPEVISEVPQDRFEDNEDEDTEPIEPELGPMNFKLNLTQPSPAEQSLAFEPLHVTDYFASLGIKLSGDVKQNDKLGKQLKSFTEWLKTMKKIHTDELPGTGLQDEQTIQKLAEKSNTEDEVVTEAMAEVLIQQGKAVKAIDVYKKLSLLNPAKTVYFAAKIENLKEA